MFYFLQPIWLWASSVVILPVLIHLWNIRQGKTLKVGSIALFAKSAASHTKSLRITDWLLLLLRCLLIVTLIILIAKPIWKQQNTAKEKGWILVENGSLTDAYKAYHSIIDTLLQQGYTLHYFNENFAKAETKDTLTKSVDSVSNTSLSYWTLLKLLNQKLPSDFPVQLFTGNRLQRFSGNRPSSSLSLTWHIIPTKDTAAKWLEKASLISSDSVRITEGNSTASSTLFTHQNVSLNINIGSYKIIHQNGKPLIADASKQTVELDTSAITISIYTTAFAADATYLEAALNAIKKVTQRRMNISVVGNKENIPSDANWVFWLSDETMPQLNQSTKLFVYEEDENETTHSWLVANDEQALTVSQNIQLYKRVKNASSSSQTIWKDGYGKPVLAKQNGNGTIYHFYSRFNPQWSDLVWNSDFPQLLYNLMFDEQNNMNRSNTKDNRVIDSSQMQPQVATQKYMPASTGADTEMDLSIWFWSFAFLLFFAERVLSFRKQNTSEA